ncbi:hypothetical protein R6Z07F_016015 [Ovis aries]
MSRQLQTWHLCHRIPTANGSLKEEAVLTSHIYTDDSSPELSLSLLGIGGGINDTADDFLFWVNNANLGNFLSGINHRCPRQSLFQAERTYQMTHLKVYKQNFFKHSLPSCLKISIFIVSYFMDTKTGAASKGPVTTSITQKDFPTI